jgi:hypothetical protein
MRRPPGVSLLRHDALFSLLSLPFSLSRPCSLSQDRSPEPSSATIHRRHSAPSPASLTSRGALPRRPLPPRQPNRPGVPGITATHRRFLAGPNRCCLELLAAGLSSGQADLAGEPRVSRRSSWTLSPPFCWPEPPPESRPAPCRHGHGLPSSWPAWPAHVAMGPSGQWPWVNLAWVQKFCICLLSRNISE